MLQTARQTLQIDNCSYTYYSLAKLAEHLGYSFTKLPYSLKILLENLLRNTRQSLNPQQVTTNLQSISTIVHRQTAQEIYFYPTRVLMQDFTGVPAVVDLAAMRDACKAYHNNPQQINPCIPVDLVIDHSIQVQDYGNEQALAHNFAHEMSLNKERYEFLAWASKTFKNFRVVPPGIGICHQVNLEYLAKVIWQEKRDDQILLFPDTVIGTDSHTTMINGLSVLGWGVGGIEAEAVMLGQPVSMLVPKVVGVRLNGHLSPGITATDVVLTITHLLRKHGVVNKFVEFCGSGLSKLSVFDRATIANMSPEYGATCGFFPIDTKTLEYLHITGRSDKEIAIVENYAKAQDLWYLDSEKDFDEVLEINLNDCTTTLAGPKRPQDSIMLSNVKQSFQTTFAKQLPKTTDVLHHGAVVIAAITSCTNTSNPAVMIGAGLLARNAIQYGLCVKPWVKTSLAPGSKVVTAYLHKAGLQEYLNALGFNLVGYGCTTCIGNSGPLKDEFTQKIVQRDLCVAAVLSGNRNFEGRIHPLVQASYLASPILVVAYALAGTINIDLTTQPLGKNSDGRAVYLQDIWPTEEEIQRVIAENLARELFIERYKDIFTFNREEINPTYSWNEQSTYIQKPPYLQKIDNVHDIKGARILAILGDSITTDHISPAGAIISSTPAYDYLQSKGVSAMNSYGSRRGNHHVMIRGTFANLRLQNELVPEKLGGYTKYFPEDKVTSIYDAAQRYQRDNIPLVIIAGKEYGTGSSRDWAAKGTLLLGIKAVIAESFERIHRTNLICMGVLPLSFTCGINRKTLQLNGEELIDINNLYDIQPKQRISCMLIRKNGYKEVLTLQCCINTAEEMQYYKSGGILQYVLSR